MLIAIGELRQHLASDAVRFVGPHAGLARHVLAARMDNDFVEAAKMGADVATIPASVIRQLFNHPLTDKGLAAFVADWQKTGQTIPKS